MGQLCSSFIKIGDGFVGVCIFHFPRPDDRADYLPGRLLCRDDWKEGLLNYWYPVHLMLVVERLFWLWAECGYMHGLRAFFGIKECVPG